ncbi:DUF445 family protein [Phreatobacter aquaticus]|uniref:DUF445 family protein n=1 Tax=Phreatobacter aquaticus TaxID=2570229 RepID=A0A4D7QU43_9HYPH|nr:DUF445 family protein [Phreatobacter aquaticus]QCK88547.1 DUF445 family protein [Phreatobacter aquaticus]
MTDRDRDKLAGLRKAKVVATSLLVGSVSLMVVSKLLEARYPAFGYVAAFAEAATIGGLADWYAVVALFKRPMGLPIPHTAIIQQNQGRIADSLGEFVETNFLAPEPVAAKLREVDFASLISEWLSDPAKSGSLSRFVLKLVPQAMASMDNSRLKDFVSERLMEQVGGLKIAPIAAQLLSAVTADGRHQKLLDQLLGAIETILTDQAALDGIRDKIRQELPSLFKLFQADAYLLKKIIASTGSFLDDVRGDPDHALRREFDRFVQAFIINLRDSPDYAERAEKLKRDLLGRQEVRGLAQEMWKSLTAFLERDAQSPESRIEAHLAGLLTDIGRKLATDERMSREINQGFVVALSAFVEQQKSSASTFIADQVKSWDMQQMIRLMELNIGRDLQYIRLNGTLIGGLAGLVLHVIEVLFRLA